ncbi:MAG TPA: PadR family transcriptional regulator [Spirochaetales bacterium]|nr:PadR family transcriptional regulator [Spirochaetales bacterium]HPM72088.1 PadR family transcriptional regulator [Spirochaetales bacterium]
MDKPTTAAPRRHAPALRPEFVPLGFIVERPSYGYEVYRRFSDSLSGLWGISESQMYATLKRLEERGLVVHLAGAAGNDSATGNNGATEGAGATGNDSATGNNGATEGAGAAGDELAGSSSRRRTRRGPGAEKRLLAPSDAGLAAFDAWLAETTPTSPRVLRLEFVTRLFFATRRDPSAGAALFAAQRAAVIDAIGRLREGLAVSREGLAVSREGLAGDGGAAGFDPSALALSFSEGQLVAVLEWMDASVAPALS